MMIIILIMISTGESHTVAGSSLRKQRPSDVDPCYYRRVICIYIYIYIYTHIHELIYIYIYIHI